MSSIVFVSFCQILGYTIDLGSTSFTAIFTAVGNSSLLAPIGVRLLTNIREESEKGLKRSMGHHSGDITSLNEIEFAEPSMESGVTQDLQYA